MTSCPHCGSPDQDGAFCGNCGRPVATAAPSDPTIAPGSTTAFPPVPDGPPPQGPPPGAWDQPAYPPTPPPAPDRYGQPGQYGQYGQPPQPGYGQPSQPAYGQAPQPGYPPQGYGQPAYPPPGYPAAPAQPRVNPFLGWPVSDYVRDAAAIVCLFATLGMVWDIDSEGNDHWWVVLSALVGVLAVAVPYVAKARLVPAVGPPQWLLVRAALLAPMAISALVAVVNELIHVADPFEGHVGTGVAMGLTGVALALQPRQADEGPGAPQRLWLAAIPAVTFAYLGLLALTTLGWLLHGFVSDETQVFDELGAVAVLFLGIVVVNAVAVVWPAAAQLGGAVAWRRTFATVGFTVLAVALLAGPDPDGLFSTPPAEKWDGLVGEVPPTALLLLGVAAALAVSRPALRAASARGQDPVAGWTATAVAALRVSAATSAAFALTVLVNLVVSEVTTGTVIGLLLALVAAGGAGFASTRLTDPRRTRLLVLAVCAGLVVLGFVLLGVANGSSLGLVAPDGFPLTLWYADSGWVTAAWLSLPGLVAWSLLGPRPVRDALGPLQLGGLTGAGHGQQPPGQPHPGQPYPGQPYPGQPYPGQPHPGQPYPGQPQPGQPYPGRPGQQYPPQPPGQPYPYGQPQPGQPYPYGQPQQPGQQPGYGQPPAGPPQQHPDPSAYQRPPGPHEPPTH